MKLSQRQQPIAMTLSTYLIKDLAVIVAEYVYKNSFKSKPKLFFDKIFTGQRLLLSMLLVDKTIFKWDRITSTTGFLGIYVGAPKPEIIVTTPPVKGPWYDHLAFFSGEMEDELWLFQDQYVMVFSANTFDILRTQYHGFQLGYKAFSCGNRLMIESKEGVKTVFE
jgi:hypothetical protein